MKKTRKKIYDTIDLITVVDDNGEELTFLNGVIQMTAAGRFIAARSPVDGQLSLIIEDYAWWHVNHFDITDWMREHLPRGEEHQRGMVLTFDSEEQRTWFLLRWG